MPYTLSPASPELLPLDSQRGGENRWTLNFGPQHPATHTTLRLVLELDGERVVRCTPHIGYLHSGFENLGEHLNYNQYVTIVDRMDYSAPIYTELAWHGASEKLMAMELTPLRATDRPSESAKANPGRRANLIVSFASAPACWL